MTWRQEGKWCEKDNKKQSFVFYSLSIFFPLNEYIFMESHPETNWVQHWSQMRPWHCIPETLVQSCPEVTALQKLCNFESDEKSSSIICSKLASFLTSKGFISVSIKGLTLQGIFFFPKLQRWSEKMKFTRNLPRRGRPPKIIRRAEWWLFKGMQHNVERATGVPHLSWGQSSWFNKKEGTEQKKKGIHGRLPRQKSLLTKKNIKAHLTLAKHSWMIPKTYGRRFNALIHPSIFNTTYPERGR